MTDFDRKTHWDNVYTTKHETEVSWFEASPAISLDLIHATGVSTGASIIDIGGGASRLVDGLLSRDFKAITVLDLSMKALEAARTRLEEAGSTVDWVVADVTKWEPSRSYDVWHDRAAFHFLTEPHDQAGYAEQVSKAVHPGGHVIIGTFAPDGPERCSNLQVVRHDAASIGKILGNAFVLADERRHGHETPSGSTQWFQFSRFRRIN